VVSGVSTVRTSQVDSSCAKLLSDLLLLLFQHWQGFQGPWKAGLTSGTMSAAGDLLAQFLTGQLAKVSRRGNSGQPVFSCLDRSGSELHAATAALLAPLETNANG
jgi:hypothetical protein